MARVLRAKRASMSLSRHALGTHADRISAEGIRVIPLEQERTALSVKFVPSQSAWRVIGAQIPRTSCTALRSDRRCSAGLRRGARVGSGIVLGADRTGYFVDRRLVGPLPRASRDASCDWFDAAAPANALSVRESRRSKRVRSDPNAPEVTIDPEAPASMARYLPSSPAALTAGEVCGGGPRAEGHCRSRRCHGAAHALFLAARSAAI